MAYENPEMLRTLGREHVERLIAEAEQERRVAKIVRETSQLAQLRDELSDRLPNWARLNRRVARSI